MCSYEFGHVSAYLLKLLYVNSCMFWPEIFLFCPLYVFIHFFLYSTFHLRSCTIEMSIIIISFYAVAVKKGGMVELYSIYSTAHSICAVKETGYMDVSISVMVLLCCGGCVGVTVLWWVWCICAVLSVVGVVYLCCSGCDGVSVLWWVCWCDCTVVGLVYLCCT